jgi:hypothetical protein
MIRIDAVWLAVNPLDMRAGTDSVRIPLMADSDSTFIADIIPCDGGHPELVS